MVGMLLSLVDEYGAVAVSCYAEEDLHAFIKASADAGLLHELLPEQANTMWHESPPSGRTNCVSVLLDERGWHWVHGTWDEYIRDWESRTSPTRYNIAMTYQELLELAGANAKADVCDEDAFDSFLSAVS